MKKIEQGRSMIEMLGVLAIVGVLSVGGIVAYNLALSKFKANKTIDIIQTMATNIRNLYAGQGNYQGLDGKLLVNAGVADSIKKLPNSDGSDGTLVTPFGGNFLVQNEDGSVNGFKITLKDIPKSACPNIATSGWGDRTSGLYQLKVGSTDVIKGDGSVKNVAEIVAMCSGTVNDLVFTFN